MIALIASFGFWLSSQPALAAECVADYQGTCYFTGKCLNPDEIPIAGAEACGGGAGGVCCIGKAKTTPPACMGFCIESGKCDSVLPAPNKCDGGLVCCGVEKKETVAPTGQACCMPVAQCTTKINTGIVCPNAGDGCCIPAGAAGGGTQSTLGNTCGSYKFPCPLGTDIPSLVGGIVRWLLGFVGALFLAMFIWGGTLYITAGDSKRAEDGKKTLVNAVIGVMIVALSYTLIGWVMEKLTSAIG